MELGRYMKSCEVDVGGHDMTTADGGALQRGIRAGVVNVAAIADDNHNLLAFGISIGTARFCGPRSRIRVGLYMPQPREIVAK